MIKFFNKNKSLLLFPGIGGIGGLTYLKFKDSNISKNSGIKPKPEKPRFMIWSESHEIKWDAYIRNPQTIPDNEFESYINYYRHKHEFDFNKLSKKQQSIVLTDVRLYIEVADMIPEKYYTQDICNNLVHQSPPFFIKIPRKYMSKELCEVFFKRGSGGTFNEAPKDILTKEYCTYAVENNGANLKYVPEEFIDQDLCNISFLKDINNICFIPKKYINNEISYNAVLFNGSNIKYIPKELITKEICDKAVLYDGHNVVWIPDELITKEMCEITIRTWPDSVIRNIPEKFLTKELIYMAAGFNALLKK